MPTLHRVSRRRTKVMGLLGPVLETRQPARIEGTRQMGGEWMPPACPHCQAAPPMWHVTAEVGDCRCCGADWYATAHVYQLPPPARYAVPSHRLPNMGAR